MDGCFAAFGWRKTAIRGAERVNQGFLMGKWVDGEMGGPLSAICQSGPTSSSAFAAASKAATSSD